MKVEGTNEPSHSAGDASVCGENTRSQKGLTAWDGKKV